MLVEQKQFYMLSYNIVEESCTIQQYKMLNNKEKYCDRKR